MCCDAPLSDERPTVTLREKGSAGINKASQEHGSSIRTEAGQTVQNAKGFVMLNL